MKKILLVRPPRYSWPLYKESSNFIFPLGLLCVAGAIKRHLPHIEVKILDCLPLKIGWNSLKSILKEENPDFVGAGEGVIYQHEAGRLFTLAKEINPEVITIAGGHFFSWMVNFSLNNYPIDFIVRFEGEETIVDLLRTLDSRGDLSQAKNIAYKNNGRIIKNPLRPLVNDLDMLPLPAFDLIPVETYSFWKYAFGKAANLEHSRGCIDTCSFCAMWTFWGKHLKADIEHNELEIVPKYRTKSVERTLEEVDIVYKKYNRRFIFWVDSTFSTDPRWTDEFCEKLIKRNYKDLHWFAYLRADFTLRDEGLGILEKMVRSGLIYCYIGVERASTEELKKLRKSGYSPDIIKEAFLILKQRYPQVIRQATYLTCLPYDNKESLMTLAKFAIELDADYDLFYLLHFFPGTFIYQKAKADNRTVEASFKGYEHLHNLICSTVGASASELETFLYRIITSNIIHQIGKVKRLFSPHRIKRRFHHSSLQTFLRLFLLRLIMGRRNVRVPCFLRPRWYEH